MEKVLNQLEIDAMVQAARGQASVSVTGTTVVQPWDVRQAGQIGNDQLRAITQLHEIFARSLTNSVGASLRVGFECSLVSAEHLTYREFLQRIPEKTYLASCKLAPAEVTALLQLDLAVALPIVDVLLGGEGTGTVAEREITEIEEQVLEDIMRIVCRELQIGWESIALEFKFGQRQHVAQIQRLMMPDEKSLCLCFEIKMSETRGTLNVAIPAVVSNALLRKVSADLSYQRPHGVTEARRQIEKQLLKSVFTVELSLPHLTVPLQALADLAPGDVLPLPRSATAPALLQIEGVRLSTAAPVRVGQNRAGSVLSLEPAGES